MRHLFTSHMEKCSTNLNNHPLKDLRLPKATHIGPVINNVETITIDHPTEPLEPRPSNITTTSPPPSPPNGVTRSVQSVSPYHSGSNIPHQSTRAPHSSEMQSYPQAPPRQGSATLPINIPSHSTAPPHHFRQIPLQTRMLQTSGTRPTSLPQTLTVSPIQILSPTPTRPTPSNHQPSVRHSQPGLNPIKVEFPPFKPSLPYVVDDEVTIEKEVDTKKKHASPMIYDVEESFPASIHRNPFTCLLVIYF